MKHVPRTIIIQYNNSVQYKIVLDGDKTLRETYFCSTGVKDGVRVRGLLVSLSGPSCHNELVRIGQVPRSRAVPSDVCLDETLENGGRGITVGRTRYNVSTCASEYERLQTCALNMSRCWVSSSICFTTPPKAASSLPEVYHKIIALTRDN